MPTTFTYVWVVSLPLWLLCSREVGKLRTELGTRMGMGKQTVRYSHLRSHHLLLLPSQASLFGFLNQPIHFLFIPGSPGLAFLSLQTFQNITNTQSPPSSLTLVVTFSLSRETLHTIRAAL